MKFTLSWLKQHLDTTASLQEICDKLTAIGLEVEKIEDHGKALAPFIIAHVIEAKPHPNADRLRVATVDTGKEKLQVVCGAPNCRTGMKAVLARPGDVVPSKGEALKKGVIRGVESMGMLCGADELGIGEDDGTHNIVDLPADAPTGANFAHYAGYDDPVIEINLTPNRPDCMGVHGIARDLAAAGLGKLKPLEIKPVKGTFKSPVKIVIDLPKGEEKACPLIVGRHIKGLKNGKSPQWLQDRLRAIGVNIISAVVDITNLTAYDVARPLHAFDAAKLRGVLRAHFAKGGEQLTLLNGKTYTMQLGMTVISDDTGPLELSAIMGGKSTSCDANTTEIFIISALFDPARTARTGRALQISSDARYRFERGLDPLFAVPGAELATKLVLDLCGTPQTEVSELVIAGAVPVTERTILLDPKKCASYAGLDVPEAEQEKILVALGFGIKRQNLKLAVAVPSWRPDIEGAADLVEEIARIKGYDHIPAVSLEHTDAVTHAALDALDQRGNAARRALAAQGLMEAVTWSFMSGAIAAQFGFTDQNLRLLNPISADLDVMRPSILGNLVLAAKRNADRGFSDVGIFEVGPVYKSASPEGQEMVATALRAGMTPRNWAAPARPVDAFDAKADAIATLAMAGAPVNSLQVTADAPSYFHPGRSGALRLGSTALAYFGEIHPAVLAVCDASGPMAACEVFVASVPQSRSGNARPLLKLEPLQPLVRDFAFVVGRDVSAAKLIRAAKDAEKNLIHEVTVFDVYEGERLGANKKSIAISVTLQPSEKTLTDAEIEQITARITASVTKATGAVLRN